jgi:hypothetical protein
MVDYAKEFPRRVVLVNPTDDADYAAGGGATPSEAHTTALAASLVVKASAGTLLSITGYNNSSSEQYIQVHNTTSLPSNTAVPIIVFKAQPNDNFGYFLDDLGQSFATGITVCNSSTAATKTIGSADCWFNVRYR